MASNSSIAPGLKLEVLTGAHAGGRLANNNLSAVVIGSAPDCDVVLSDEGIAPHHCVLVSAQQGFAARGIEGHLGDGSGGLPQASLIDIRSGQTLQLLPSNVELAVCHSSAANTPSGAIESKPPAPHPAPWRKRLAALALTTAFGIFTCLWVIASNTSVPVASTQPTDSLKRILSDLDLSDDVQFVAKQINTENTQPQPLVLTGVIERTASDSLKESLSNLQLTVDWRITTSDELLERVSDVFRTNGYTSKLEYLDSGNVRVLNLDQDNIEVQRVAEHVRRDVPALGKLIFANLEPKLPKSSLPIYAAIPGKRMTTIVDGDIAYVATEDGSRYFIGSVLPGGSSIRTISHDGVQVDYNGVLSWIRF